MRDCDFAALCADLVTRYKSFRVTRRLASESHDARNRTGSVFWMLDAKISLEIFPASNSASRRNHTTLEIGWLNLGVFDAKIGQSEVSEEGTPLVKGNLLS